MRDPRGRGRQPLARLSGGRPARAASILVVCYLAAAALPWAAWAFGLAPFLADARPVAGAVVAVVGLATCSALVLVFGSWPIPLIAAGGRLSGGYGERYGHTFGAATGFRLGLLRAALQFAVTGSCLAALFLALLDVRWFNLLPTKEMRSLPGRAATLPVPADWRPVASDTDLEVDDDVKVPNASVERVYAVADSVSVDSLREWLSAPVWSQGPDGSAFGAIALERCDRSTCHAHLVPGAGDAPEFFVTTRLDVAPSGRQVTVRVSYQRHVAAELAVSAATVDRAESIPVPDDWVRYAVEGSGRGVTTSERYRQSFGVPASFTAADLDAWLASPAWTAPVAGPPFGPITLDRPCSEGRYVPGYRCDVTASATAHAGVSETLTVALSPDHTVTVEFTRDW